MEFLIEPEPQRGIAVELAPGIRRIVAPNPGPMTYHGTNTYLLEELEMDGVTVLDPGPDDATHLQAVLKAAGRVARIVVSHGHVDHVAGLAAMRAISQAPVYAFDAALQPDHLLAHGSCVAGWTALHTPGHAADHLCFSRRDGVLLSADHVMGWSTSVVPPPPDGDMAAYFASLRLLLDRRDWLYLPGHGPAIREPQAYVQALLDHRTLREQQVLEALAPGPLAADALVSKLYPGLAPGLRPMAERSLLSHLAKLQDEERVVRRRNAWAIPVPRRAHAKSA
jgi:glyoxylase-like metal-dependent hydrolase (beta-lactamase superfamily II)